jgi:predicted nuclease of predicted toxin-antitoxin system
MRFLIDQGLPRSTVKILSQLQIDSIHVGDIGMAVATDLEIIQKATEESLTVITLDSDFHTILASSGRNKPSVIRIRIEGLKADKLADLIQSVIDSIHDEIMSGAAISITEKGIRVRRLPLV